MQIDLTKSSSGHVIESKRQVETTDFPLSQSDRTVKPTYSYASLIGMAILGSEDGRARLSTIYQWISDNFPYYQLDQGGWQVEIVTAL
jgi:forkhead transcription factor HCM1